MLPPRHSLAWFNLTSENAACDRSGGCFLRRTANVYVSGFENALYDSQVQLLKLLNGDIIINRLKYNMFVPEQFARRRLYQALLTAWSQPIPLHHDR